MVLMVLLLLDLLMLKWLLIQSIIFILHLLHLLLRKHCIKSGALNNVKFMLCFKNLLLVRLLSGLPVRI